MTDRGFGQKSNLSFRVETNWPDESRPEDSNKFSCYYASAYTDIRNPGKSFETMLINTQKELFDKRRHSQYSGLSEILIFDNREDAIAVAQFLEQFGRMSAGWDTGSQEQYREKRRGPLKVRVVEEFNLNNRTEVLFEHVKPEPIITYESELAKLKKKYGKE